MPRNHKNTLVVSPMFFPATELPRGVLDMLETAHYHGIDVTPIGQGQSFGNFRSAKIDRLYMEVAKMRGYDYVMMVDACDTLFAADLCEIHSCFEGFDCPFVIGGESNCWPADIRPEVEETYRNKYPQHRFRYLNTGFYMATRDAFQAVLGKLQSLFVGYADDQGLFHKAWMAGEINLRIDYECRLCQCLYGVTDADVQWGKRPRNLSYGTHPCVFHGNGISKSQLGKLKQALTQ